MKIHANIRVRMGIVEGIHFMAITWRAAAARERIFDSPCITLALYTAAHPHTITQ